MAHVFEVRDGARSVGSFSGNEIRQLAADGKLNAGMQIRRLPDGAWSPLSNVKGLHFKSPLATTAPAVAVPLPVRSSPTQAPPLRAAPADFDALAVNLLSQATPRAAAAPMEIECPYCSEPIKATAKKCKHCGEFLDERDTAGPSSAISATNQTVVAVPSAKPARVMIVSSLRKARARLLAAMLAQLFCYCLYGVCWFTWQSRMSGAFDRYEQARLSGAVNQVYVDEGDLFFGLSEVLAFGSLLGAVACWGWGAYACWRVAAKVYDPGLSVGLSIAVVLLVCFGIFVQLAVYAKATSVLRDD